MNCTQGKSLNLDPDHHLNRDIIHIIIIIAISLIVIVIIVIISITRKDSLIIEEEVDIMNSRMMIIEPIDNDIIVEVDIKNIILIVIKIKRKLNNIIKK